MLFYKKSHDNYRLFLMHMDSSFVDEVPVDEEALIKWLEDTFSHKNIGKKNEDGSKSGKGVK